MTQFDRSSISRYAEADKAGLSDREATSLSDGNRLETAYQHIARWLGAAWIGLEATGEGFDSNRDGGRPSGNNSTTDVSLMLPSLASAKRKPWVVSQLSA